MSTSQVTPLLPREQRRAAARATTDDGSRLVHVPVGAIEPNPHQPRQHFDPEDLNALAMSLRQHGCIQPIVLRPAQAPDTYTLVAGERRWRAAGLAGLATIPAVVRDVDEMTGWVAAVIENVDRVNLNPIEEGLAYRALLTGLGLTQERLADRIGVSRRRISQAVLLVDLPEPVQAKCAAGVITFGHARALCGLRDPYQQIRLAERIVREGITVNETEVLVAAGNLRGAEPEPVKRARGPRTPRARMARVSSALADTLDTSVQVLPPRGRSRGRVVIDFADDADLMRVLEKLRDVRPPVEALQLDTEDAAHPTRPTGTRRL